MPETCDELALYLHLARASEVRRRPLVRDKLLVLAGKTDLEMRLEPIAEHCRAKVLAHNPGHILRNYATLADALADETFRSFFKRLSQAYPRERAEHMLRSLGIQLAGERHVYADELEYAAALLGTTPERLGDIARQSAAVATNNAEPANSPLAGLPVRVPLAGLLSPARFRRASRWQALLFVRLAAVAATLLAIAGLIWFLVARTH